MSPYLLIGKYCMNLHLWRRFQGRVWRRPWWACHHIPGMNKSRHCYSFPYLILDIIRSELHFILFLTRETIWIQDWVHKTGLDMFIPHHWDDGTNKAQFEYTIWKKVLSKPCSSKNYHFKDWIRQENLPYANERALFDEYK